MTDGVENPGVITITPNVSMTLRGEIVIKRSGESEKWGVWRGGNR